MSRTVSRFLTVLFLFYTSTLYGAAYPDVSTLFTEEFETGKTYRWTSEETQGAGSVIAVDNSIVNTGQYSCKLSIDNASADKRSYMTKGHDSSDPIYARFYVYLGSNFTIPTSGSVQMFMFSKTGVGSLEGIELYNNAGNIQLRTKGDQQGGTPTVLSTETWYCLEVKYDADASAGEITIWIDGVQEVSVTNLSNSNESDEVRLGWIYGASTNAYSGSIYVDDLVVDDARATCLVDPSIRLIYPDARGRTAFPVRALIYGDDDTDKLVATLTDTGVYSQIQEIESGPLNHYHVFTTSLDGVNSGTYTLTVELKTSGDSQRCSTTYSFTKSYNGNPVLSIDAHSNIVLNGDKFFPVTSFGLTETNTIDIAAWVSAGYINFLYGQDWSGDNLVGWQSYLEEADTNSVYAMGPLNYADQTVDGVVCENGYTDATHHFSAKCAEHVIQNSSSYDRAVAWSFAEEPFENNYDDHMDIVKDWWDEVKTEDDDSPMHLNVMGQFVVDLAVGDAAYSTNRDNLAIISPPYWTADIYGFDTYPIEYSGYSMADMGLGVDNFRAVTFDMSPIFSFVQTDDAREEGGETCGDELPTAAQIKQMCWVNVVHGAKGINWYHYSCISFGSSQMTAMSDFVTDISYFTDAVLSDTSLTVSSSNSNVHLLGKTYGGTDYVFAVNVTTSAQNDVQVTVPGVLPQDIISVYDESRQIDGSDGYFVDSFSSEAVHIYEIKRAGTISGCTISGGTVQ